MSRSALACLPAAILAAFIGAIAMPVDSHASSPSACTRSDEISLQRPDLRQFELPAPGAADGTQPRADLSLAAPLPSAPTRQAIALDTGCITPSSPTDLEPTSGDVETLARATAVLNAALYVVGFLFFLKIGHAIGDSLHGESPTSQGAAR